ncbi:carbon-phosphorus lyase complex subunit PhnI [Microlunatus speluncae]|uniref:carbon-phosphorus lyase complex subunit PhnI n=1 Tax=Microlunatus speluncae TaxID=2594267 RepID=UPI001C2CE5A3|nr:carbon-phosphorus lyase complex subunit PhnI [Microlunatus speluncae]
MYAGTNKGGTEAIIAAERLVLQRRSLLDGVITVDQVIECFPIALDKIMGEGGLWDPPTAATAFLQAGGDAAEAVHLLRAHRSTLPRLAYSEPVQPRELELLRRIVPAHRKPDGPQLLGETVDYTARLIHLGGEPPLPVEPIESVDHDQAEPEPDEPFRRYRDYLADRGVLVDRSDPADPEPFDLALVAPQLPAERSALLSAMALAETGGLINIWYQSIIGPDGYTDESVTLGEVRHGRIPVRVRHPHTGNPVQIGRIRVSETEAITHLTERGEDAAKFDVGYGMALGHNERKTIAMASLDCAAQRFRGTEGGKRLDQILLHTTDGLASCGFLEHLKLPHYVTFRSQLERAEAAAGEAGTLINSAIDQEEDCDHDHEH